MSALQDSAVGLDEQVVERQFVLGTVVEHAGRRWRVDGALGADAVLLEGESGPPAAAHPAQVTFGDQRHPTPSRRSAVHGSGTATYACVASSMTQTVAMLRGS